MTDQISFPPLHELAPGELERRKEHLVSEIRRGANRGTFSLPKVRVFPRVAVVMVATAALLAATSIAAVVVMDRSSGSGGGQPPLSAGQMHFNPGGTYYATVDWAEPGGKGGVAVDSIADAASQLPFQPVVPADLGAPSAVAVDPNPDGSPQLDVAYKISSSDASYWVVERASQDTTSETLAGYAELAASVCQPEGTCEASWSAAQLDGGRQGLLVQGPVGTTVAVDWVENGIYFTVIGPSDSFSAEKATSVANSVISGSAMSS